MTGCGRKLQPSEQFCSSSVANLLCVYFPSLGLISLPVKSEGCSLLPMTSFRILPLQKADSFDSCAIQPGPPGLTVQLIQVECVLDKDAPPEGWVNPAQSPCTMHPRAQLLPMEEERFFPHLHKHNIRANIAPLSVISYPCPPPHWTLPTFLLVIILPSLPLCNHSHCLLPTVVLRSSISAYQIHLAAWPPHSLMSFTPTILFSTPWQPPTQQSHHRPCHY